MPLNTPPPPHRLGCGGRGRGEEGQEFEFYFDNYQFSQDNDKHSPQAAHQHMGTVCIYEHYSRIRFKRIRIQPKILIQIQILSKVG